jgi:membrane associated rhomboid family serine protease/tetratricopeptide (TPR) repeat protein
VTEAAQQPDWGGLNPATLGWLGRSDCQPAVQLAGYLVGNEDWNLLRNPKHSEEAALILHGGKSGIILVPATDLTPDVVAATHQRWFGLLKKLPKSWQKASLVFLTSGPLSAEIKTALEGADKKNFFGRRLTSAALDVSTQETHGPLPDIAKLALDSPDECSILELHQKLKKQDEGLRQFIGQLADTKSWGTYLVMGLCVAVFAWASAAGGTENTFVLLRFGANYRPLTVDAGQWWRLIGSAFLHIGWLHLLVNMYSLYAVGPTLEKFIGNFRYLTLYAVAAVSGSAASAFLGASHVSAGASGAIFGLFGACAVLGYRHREAIPKPIQQSLVGGMLPAIGYNLIYGFSVPGIDNAAHIGGLIAGAVMVSIVPPKIVKKELKPATRAVFISLSLVMSVVQLFTMGQALEGFQFEKLPKRTVNFSNWSVQLPTLFQESQDGTYYEGPGVNLFCTVVDRVIVSGQAPDPEQLKLTLAQEVGFPLQYQGERPSSNGKWYLFESSEKVAGRYAVGFDGFQQFLIGAFVAPDAANEADMMISALLPTVKCSLHEANTAFANKDYQQALQLYQGELDSPNAGNAALLGQTFCLIGLGKNDEALLKLQRVIETVPDSSPLLRLRVGVLWNMGRLAEAIQDISALLQKIPKDSPERQDLLFKRAQLYYRSEKPELGNKDIEALLSTKDPQIKALALNTRAWFRARSGDLDGSLADVTEALKLFPQGSLYDTRAYIQLQRGAYEEALADCELALEKNPTRGHSWYLKGSALAKLGRTTEAKMALEAALEFPEQGTPFHQAAREELQSL